MSILAGSVAAIAAVAPVTTAAPAAAAPTAALASSGEQDLAAELARFEYIIDRLRNCHVREGWSIDDEAATRALQYYRAGCPDDDEWWGATIDFIRSHGQSFDWILLGDPGHMICKVAGLSARALALQPADPIFAAIDRHKAAMEVQAAALADVPDIEDGTPAKAAVDAASKAWRAFFRTKPTTVAGVAAALRHYISPCELHKNAERVLGVGMDMWPDDIERQIEAMVATLGFLGGNPAAITAIPPGDDPVFAAIEAASMAWTAYERALVDNDESEARRGFRDAERDKWWSALKSCCATVATTTAGAAAFSQFVRSQVFFDHAGTLAGCDQNDPLPQNLEFIALGSLERALHRISRSAGDTAIAFAAIRCKEIRDAAGHYRKARARRDKDAVDARHMAADDMRAHADAIAATGVTCAAERKAVVETVEWLKSADLGPVGTKVARTLRRALKNAA